MSSYTATARGRAFSPLPRAFMLARDYILDLAVLVGAFLVALYLRQTLPFGKHVGVNYQWNSLGLYLILAAALAVSYLLRLLPPHLRPEDARRRYWTPILGVALACLALTIFLPRQSGLEKAYFAVSALGLFTFVLPWPSRSTHTDGGLALSSSLTRLWANRSLLRIWVQYNVQSRYAQAFLGILWIVLLPLSTAFVMSLVFSQFLRVQLGNVPFIAFFLAGFVPWGLFNQSVAASMRAIISAMGLINQIYFPREIIILSALGEALVDTFFMFIAMLIIDAIVGIYPTLLWAALPIVLVIQMIFSLGIMLIVSWLSVLIRDIPQLVSVLLQTLFYLSPIIYPIKIVPAHLRFVITLNPITSVVEAYQRIIVYGQPPDWLSLVYPGAMGIALLVFGYRLFKSNEDRMADMV